MPIEKTDTTAPSHNLPDVLHRGDIIGVKWNKPGWISRSIMKHQREVEGLPDELAEISHVLIVTNPKRFIGYEEWPPRGGRVDILQKYRDCTLKVYRYQFDNESQEDRLKLTFDIVDEIVSRTRLRYNYVGVGMFVIGASSKAENTFFCSQVISRGFREYGFILIKNLPDEKISPGRLCGSQELRHQMNIEVSPTGSLVLHPKSLPWV